jgi:hypothetical protein
VKRLINRLFGWGVWRRFVIIDGPLTGVVEWRKRGWRYSARVLTPIEGRGALYFVRFGFAQRMTASGTARDDAEGIVQAEAILAGEEKARA